MIGPKISALVIALAFAVFLWQPPSSLAIGASGAERGIAGDAPSGHVLRAAARDGRPPSGSSPKKSGWADDAAPASPLCGRRICVHWTNGGRDEPMRLDGEQPGRVPEYVRATLAAAELSYEVQVGRLGWRKPKSDRGESGGSQLDIFLSNVRDLGFVVVDPGQRGSRRSAYVVVKNRMKNGDPLPLLQVTVAHEFNHVLQFGYDYFSQPWHDESVATYMEELTYPGVNDYVSWVAEFSDNPTLPLTTRGGKSYGAAIFNHFLAGRFGDALIRESWAELPGAKHLSTAAYDRAIVAAGGGGFAEQLIDFYTETAELRVSDRFPDAALYPDVARSGELAVGQSSSARLDNTSFALFDVAPAGGGQLALSATAPLGLDAAIALVGRRAGDDAIVKSIDTTYEGGALQVTLDGAQEFERITAVLINADASARNRKLDVEYKRNGEPFDFSLSG